MTNEQETMRTLLSRRELLKQSGFGLGMLGLAGVLADSRELLASSVVAKSANPLGVKAAHFPGRVKRVVHFFLNGGPSQVDTFDPKPTLAKFAGKPLPQSYMTERKTGGALPSPFKFKKYGQSGIEISE